MRRLIIILSALAVLAAPAAAVAKPSKADKREAQKECRAERDASSEAFDDTYRNFGTCVSQKAREAKAERKQARANAARECRAERNADREAFEEEHGTNANNRNAFGKCVSKKAKAKQAEQDAEDAEQAQEIENAAQECKAERKADREAFEEEHGTNANNRNAFGKCVSQKANEDDALSR
jgi:colicin import membrane protein